MKHIAITILVLSSFASVFGQTKMIINQYNGTADSILLSAIKSITFKTTGISQDSLVAYYPLNGNANDSSGKGNNGTPTNVTYVTGHQGLAAQFTSTSYINVADNASFDFSNATGLTISTWIRQENATAGYIIEKDGPAVLTDDEYFINISSTGQLQGAFTSKSGNSTPHQTISSKSKLTLNIWYNVVLTWKSNGVISFYINGILDDTVSSTVTSIQNTTIPLGIGNDNAHTQGFPGSIDEVYIYKRALSDVEIQALYNGQ
jgi:hypothetical protein